MTRQNGCLESRSIRINGLMMHFKASIDQVPAERLPVVLVHGLMASSRYMAPIARHLAQDFQVFAPDLPGFGKSDKPHRVLDFTE